MLRTASLVTSDVEGVGAEVRERANHKMRFPSCRGASRWKSHKKTARVPVEKRCRRAGLSPFGDIFDFKGGSQQPKKEFHNEPEAGLIRLLQIRDFGSDKYPVYIKDADKWPKCDEDDIMIARYGASLGRVLTGMAGAYNVAHVRMIFDKENLDTNWVRYFLKSEHFQEPIHLLSRSAQNGFNKTELSSIAVELPPKAEQSRIVSAIESLQERSARARVLLSEVGPLIGQLRQSVLRVAFSGKLTADCRARRSMGPRPVHRGPCTAAKLTTPANLMKSTMAPTLTGRGPILLTKRPASFSSASAPSAENAGSPSSSRSTKPKANSPQKLAGQVQGTGAG